MNDAEVKNHVAQVEAAFQRIKPIIEEYDSPIVMHTLMIVLAMIGNQWEHGPETFKAFVVRELDRLMLIEGETNGTA
jgi:hypothetical protein